MKQIYGIDLSKGKFDVNYLDQFGNEKMKTVSNKLSTVSSFLESLPQDALLVAEHTGIYGNLLLYLTTCLNVRFALVPGYEIKHSFGLLRGKSDQIDAKRIREYGERFFDKLRFVKFESEEIKELREIHVLRAQLVKERKMLETRNNPFPLCSQPGKKWLECLPSRYDELACFELVSNRLNPFNRVRPPPGALHRVQEFFIFVIIFKSTLQRGLCRLQVKS